jgi:hypothetical protein
MLTIRLEKLKNDEFNWFLTTFEAMLPNAKERLTMFDEITSNLKRCGDIDRVEETAIERDKRWITRRKNILVHSMNEYDDVTRGATGRNVRKSPTIGEDTRVPKRRSLGMLGIRAGPL